SRKELSPEEKRELAPKEREENAILLADSMVQVDPQVAGTLAKQLTANHRVMERFLQLTEVGWFKSPVLNGAPASGADKVASQQRLVQLAFLLTDLSWR